MQGDAGLAQALATPAVLAGFPRLVDARTAASESVVRRYRNTLRFCSDERSDGRLKELLVEASQREGLRVATLSDYRGVHLDVLDATSLTQTRTLKSIDGCVTTARCLARGDRAIVFESGGNTGTALTAYATRAGMETFLFLPADNLELLDSSAFDHRLAHVVAVGDPSQVKAAAAAFASERGIPKVPERPWRHEASAFIGCFVLEHFLTQGCPDYLVQGISGAFAPIGIYGVLERHRSSLPPLPRFLGVQQAANCPMARAWRSHAGPVEAPVKSTRGLLARVMYDGEPMAYGTFDRFRQILVEHGGDIVTLSRDEFETFAASALHGRGPLACLQDIGVSIGVDSAGRIVDPTGLMAFAATLREIDRGSIPAGARVMVFVTGGGATPDGRVIPSWRVGAS